ncbi:MAG: FAD-dependent oxidoreductase [Chloroflexi bacterium]|nr:FAD-dependent oxidoreductase [Chloroflexota bacterium]
MSVAQKLRCRVEQIVNHGERVYTVDLIPERRVPAFRPGQFLHLALDAYDPSGYWPDSRVFSIASSPAQRERLRISYSVRGRFTARMAQELRVGRAVWVKLPYGEFVIEDARAVVLLAGGTGITAFTAFLEGLTPDARNQIVLAYGARTSDLLIYRDLIVQRAAAIPQLCAIYFVEQTPARGELPGRVSIDALARATTLPDAALYYLSGPPAMLRTLADELRTRAIPLNAIRIDAWE